MKRVLSKTTGLMVAMAMVISLFVPAIVMAANEKDITVKFYTASQTQAQGVDDVLIKVLKGQDGKCYLKYTEIPESIKGQKGNFICRNNDGKTEIFIDDQFNSALGDTTDLSGVDVLYVKVYPTYKLTFKYVDDSGNNLENGFTIDARSDVKLGEMKDIEVDDFDKAFGEKYENMGWTDGDGSSVINLSQYKPNKETTLTKTFKLKKYTVNYNNNDGTSNKYSVVKEHGETADKEIYPPKRDGYSFVAWCHNAEGTTEYDFSLPIINDLDLYAKWSKFYQIIDGENQTITLKKGADLIVKADGELLKFSRLLVDGKEVGRNNYDLASGSTIVKIKASYLDTLPEGDHTLTFVYNDGVVSTNFRITKDDSSSATIEPTSSDSSSAGSSSNGSYSSNPKTGDMGISVWVSLLTMSMAGVAVLVRQLKKVK